jgi:hypothetical protein
MKADAKRRTALLDTIDRLDREINFARGLVSAIHDLECYDEERHDGAEALATVHIERLGEISAELLQFMRASWKQAPRR